MLVWDIKDHFNTSGYIDEDSKSEPSEGAEADSKLNRIQKSLQNYLEDAKPLKIPNLRPRVRLEGHDDSVEGLVFDPRDDTKIASVS